MSVFRVVSLLLFVSVLAACSVVDKVSPYKMDIQQGNVVTQEMVSKLKPGMTRSQVRFIMGTPLIIDAFHTDRWDYVYRFQKSGTLTEERRVTLFFEGDTLRQVSGDVVNATQSPAEPTGSAAGGKAAAAEEKGFFGQILDKVGL